MVAINHKDRKLQMTQLLHHQHLTAQFRHKKTHEFLYIHAVAGVVGEIHVGAIFCGVHIARNSPARG